MEWRDEGVIVARRAHGESAMIVEALTRSRGRHAGLVHGGARSKLSPILQIGTQVELEWRARLEDQLGTYRVELKRSRSRVLLDRAGLGALGSVASLVSFAFPDRMALPDLYDETVAFLDLLESGGNWPAAYVIWEKRLLEELGYGLDLETCAVTGLTSDLVYVSPKSGRAVCRDAGAKYADRLLPLPRFLHRGRNLAPASPVSGTPDEVLQGLKTTGHFIETRLVPAIGNRPPPAARNRFVDRLRREFDSPDRNDHVRG